VAVRAPLIHSAPFSPHVLTASHIKRWHPPPLPIVCVRNVLPAARLVNIVPGLAQDRKITYVRLVRKALTNPQMALDLAAVVPPLVRQAIISLASVHPHHHPPVTNAKLLVMRGSTLRGLARHRVIAFARNVPRVSRINMK
jgi:hypothetical protein